MSKRQRYRSSEWPGLLEQWSRSGESAERFAADLEALAVYGERLRAKADEIGGIVDTDSTLKLDKPSGA
jgi:hypothetical protein